MTDIERLPSCEDPFDHLMPVEEARQRLLAALRPCTDTDSAVVALRDAHGRVLADAVSAPFNVPTEANAAMDGYALASASIPSQGIEKLRLVGTSWAGRPHVQTINVGEAVRIYTGAVMPPGADTVVIQEHVEADDTQVSIDARVVAGRNVRAAGEDVAVGDLVFAAGRRIGAADIGVLASLGIVALRVRPRLRVALSLIHI